MKLLYKKYNLLGLLLVLICSSSFAQITPLTVEEWVVTHSLQDSTDHVPTAIDLNGNLYITGYAYSSSTGQDIVTVKIDPNGNVLWSQTYNGTGNSFDKAVGLLADTLGNVYVAGTSVGTSLTNDFVLLKYDSSGVQQFVSYYDNGTNESAVGVGVDSLGNIYIGGTSADMSSGNDFAVVKYNTVGVQQWVYRYDHNLGNDNAIAFRTSQTGITYLTGNSFDATTQNDIATVAINTLGTQLWSNRYNNAFNGNEQAQDLEVDVLGNVYVCGNTQVGSNDYDYLAIKYNSTGLLLWDNIYNGSQQSDLATAIGFDRITGDVFITGLEFLSGSDNTLTTICYSALGVQKWTQKHYATFYTDYHPKLFPDDNGGVYVTTTVVGQITQDITTLSYDQNGTEIWKKTYDSSNNESVTDLAADPFGNVYVVGQTYDGLNYQFLAIKYGRQNTLIPPDYYGEPASGIISYYQNKGQVVTNGVSAKDVYFHTTSNNPTSYLFDDKVSLVQYRIDTSITNLDSIHRVDMLFAEGLKTEPVTYEVVSDHLNFYMPHIAEGREYISGYKRVIYPSVYNGVDFHVYSNDAGLKYYFVMSKGSEPTIVNLTFNGATSLTTGANGELIVGTTLGNIKFAAPHIYQTNPANPVIIPLSWTTGYQINGNVVSFPIQSYNTSLPLIIQMEMAQAQQQQQQANGNLDWSTYFNGISADYSYDVTNDDVGNTYMVGKTQSNNFPTTFGPLLVQGQYDGFITRFDIQAKREWATYYGGSGIEAIYEVSFNLSNQDLYVIGKTSSTDISIMPIANPNNGSFYQNTGYGITTGPGALSQDAFILRLTPTPSTGTINWATYFGGSGDDVGKAIKCDNMGNVHIIGNTKTAVGGYNNCEALTVSNFPLCNPGGTAYHQGTNAGVYDIFYAKFDNNNNLLSSTFFGSDKMDNAIDVGFDNPIPSNNGVYIVGSTFKSANASVTPCTVPTNGNFPLCNGGSSPFYGTGFGNGNSEVAFIAKFDINSELKWSTLFPYVTQFQAVEVIPDLSGSGDELAFAVGYTSTIFGDTTTSQPVSSQLPIVTPAGAHRQVNNAGNNDLFITQFNKGNQLVWSTFFGSPTNEYSPMGSQSFGVDRKFIDIAASNSKDLYVMGVTEHSTAWSFVTNPNSNFYNQPVNSGENLSTSLFLAGFDANRVNFWSSLFGGDVPNPDCPSGFGCTDYNSEIGTGISVYNNESIYFSGWTLNQSFPELCPTAPNPWCQFPLLSSELLQSSGTITRLDLNFVTGIEDKVNDETNSLLIYPNPATNQITVKSIDVIEKIEIYNAIGQLIYSENVEGNLTVKLLNVANYITGVYLVKVETKNNQTQLKKLIIE